MTDIKEMEPYLAWMECPESNIEDYAEENSEEEVGSAAVDLKY